VITEAFYFLLDVQNGPDSLASFLDASATEVRDAFTPEGLAAAVRLMTKYADTPMDFPDATLVWMAEQTGTDSVLTLDRRGFSSFRFGKKSPIQTVAGCLNGRKRRQGSFRRC